MNQKFILYAAIFLLGAVVSFAATNLLKKEFFDLKSVEDSINRILQKNYPELKARISNYETEGYAYLVTVDIYLEDRKVATEVFYVIDNRILVSTENILPTNLEVEGVPIGSEKPKVTIVQFSDYACSVCAKFSLETEKKILKDFNVKIIFKSFPVHGEKSYKAAQAALCAGEQGKYLEYHYTLFERQGEWINNFSKFYDYASELRIDRDKFRSCYESEKYREKVYRDYVDGLKYGVRGTPTFFVDGMKIVGYRGYDEFAELLKKLT